MHYYQHDLALVHDRGYGQHADRCAPDILDLDYGRIRAGLAGSGVRARVGTSFGAAELPAGLLAVTGRKIAADD